MGHRALSTSSLPQLCFLSIRDETHQCRSIGAFGEASSDESEDESLRWPRSRTRRPWNRSRTLPLSDDEEDKGKESEEGKKDGRWEKDLGEDNAGSGRDSWSRASNDDDDEAGSGSDSWSRASNDDDVQVVAAQRMAEAAQEAAQKAREKADLAKQNANDAEKRKQDCSAKAEEARQAFLEAYKATHWASAAAQRGAAKAEKAAEECAEAEAKAAEAAAAAAAAEARLERKRQKAVAAPLAQTDNVYTVFVHTLAEVTDQLRNDVTTFVKRSILVDGKVGNHAVESTVNTTLSQNSAEPAVDHHHENKKQKSSTDPRGWIIYARLQKTVNRGAGVSIDAGEIVGLLLVSASFRGTSSKHVTYNVNVLVTHMDYLKMGVAKTMWRELEKALHGRGSNIPAKLMVSGGPCLNNTESMNFYQSRGFANVVPASSGQTFAGWWKMYNAK
jgi:hypothetical protein